MLTIISNKNILLFDVPIKVNNDRSWNNVN